MDKYNTIDVEDSQYTVGNIFENDVRFEIDMNDSTQMSNVNGKNEASSEASEQSSPPTARHKK